MTTALQVHPWRDGHDKTLDLLQKTDELSFVTEVSVFFLDHELEHMVEDDEVMSIFESLGTNLPKLRTVRIELSTSPHFPMTSISVPPLQALTSLLLGGGNQLKFLFLRNLRLLGDDYDANGFLEALRIHPTLHSVEIINCWFSSSKHLSGIKSALSERRNMRHIDLDRCIVINTTQSTDSGSQEGNGRGDNTWCTLPAWFPSSLSWCVYPIRCCQA